MFYILVLLMLALLLAALVKGYAGSTVDSLGELKDLRPSTDVGTINDLQIHVECQEVTSVAMNVSLSQELENFVRDSVASGRYTSASELVREALRLLQEANRSNKTLEAMARARLRSLQLDVAKAPIPKELKFSNTTGRKKRKTDAL